MLSALYGHRLSELTTFWKKTGDGHPSYSINKNAVARWQEKLFTYFVENYQHAILFTFILSMLEDDRNARPTAQQIVDKLHDLDRLFPEHESHIGECCQKSVYVSDHIQHFSIDSHPAGYYYPGACGNYTFVLADLGLNTLACDAGNAFPFNTPLHHPSELIIDCEKIRNTCEDLINRAPNTPFFRPQFVPGNQKQLRGQMGAVDLVRRSAYVNSLTNTLSKTLRCSIMLTRREKELPTFLSSRSSSRLVNICLMPICFPRCEWYGSFFFLISFKLDESRVDIWEKRHQQVRRGSGPNVDAGSAGLSE